MRNIFLLVIGLVGFVFAGTSSLYGESTPAVRERFFSISASTAQKGITLTTDSRMLTVGVPPGALPSAGTAVLRMSASRDDAPAFLPPRDGMRYMSSLFYYEFSDVLALHTEVLLALESSPVVRKAGVYLYDVESGQWFPLRTTPVNAHYFRAFSDSIRGYVAVLEYENDDAEFLSLLEGVRAVVAADADDQVYVAHNGRDALPLASITKLMTALVFLDVNPEWNTRVTIQKGDDAQPAKIAFLPGDVVTVRDLFSGMLVGSKNNAAKALRRSSGLSEIQFVKKMNERAKEIGMHETTFVDVTGLSSKNIASARDVITLLRASMTIPAIATETSKSRTRVTLLNRKKIFTVPSTNDLVVAGMKVAGKTGYIPEAGYNLALMKMDKNHSLFFVILGAPSSQERFMLARALLSRTW